MENFQPLYCTKWKIKREEKSMFFILETKIQATKVERSSSLNQKSYFLRWFMDNLLSNLQKQTRKMWNICRHKGGLCENKRKINKDYVKNLPFYSWDYVKNIMKCPQKLGKILLGAFHNRHTLMAFFFISNRCMARHGMPHQDFYSFLNLKFLNMAEPLPCA